MSEELISDADIPDDVDDDVTTKYKIPLEGEDE